MTIFRYRLIDPSLAKVKSQVPGPLSFSALPGSLRVLVDAPPSSQGDLDEVMRLYGYLPDTSLPVQALLSVSLVPGVLNVPDNNWNVLGGVVAHPSSFVTDPAQLLVRTVGAYISDGDIQVRLLEDGLMFSPEVTLPAVGGLTTFAFDAPVAAKLTRSIYTLEARLAGAAAAQVAYTTTAVLLLPGSVTP
jgi:hypothetical protein